MAPLLKLEKVNRQQPHNWPTKALASGFIYSLSSFSLIVLYRFLLPIDRFGVYKIVYPNLTIGQDLDCSPWITHTHTHNRVLNISSIYRTELLKRVRGKSETSDEKEEWAAIYLRFICTCINTCVVARRKLSRKHIVHAVCQFLIIFNLHFMLCVLIGVNGLIHIYRDCVIVVIGSILGQMNTIK